MTQSPFCEIVGHMTSFSGLNRILIGWKWCISGNQKFVFFVHYLLTVMLSNTENIKFWSMSYSSQIFPGNATDIWPWDRNTCCFFIRKFFIKKWASKTPKPLENVYKISSLKWRSCNFQKHWFFLELFKSYKTCSIFLFKILFCLHY